ncbi:hypothetical protein LTR66_000480 [Elasticomyces elasticus]|nr:hypothetical protein LTR28_005628 [Elasticomyces elasticus]KAK5000689.1 hypothetical protein LTR66_000480 [Elasticomyces elasticus]
MSIEPLFPTTLPDVPPLPTKARIVSRTIAERGKTAYTVQLGGGVTLQGISLIEILEYVSPLELERYENATFTEEQQAEEDARRQKAQRLKERKARHLESICVQREDDAQLKTADRLAGYNTDSASTVTDSSRDSRNRDGSIGRGRPRPSYAHLYKPKRARRRTTVGSALSSIRDDEQDEDGDTAMQNAGNRARVSSSSITPGSSSSTKDALPAAVHGLNLAHHASPDAKRWKLKHVAIPMSSTSTSASRSPVLKDTTYIQGGRAAARGDATVRNTRSHVSSFAEPTLISRTGSSNASPSRLSAKAGDGNVPATANSIAPLTAKTRRDLMAEGSSGSSDELFLSNIRKTMRTTRSTEPGVSAGAPPRRAGSYSGAVYKDAGEEKLNVKEQARPSSSSSAAIRKSAVLRPVSASFYTSQTSNLPPFEPPQGHPPAPTNPSNLPASAIPTRSPSTIPESDVDSEDDGESYKIERIIAHGMSDPRTHAPGLGREPVQLFRVKWVGYPLSEATWEPVDSFDDLSMVEEYLARVSE